MRKAILLFILPIIAINTYSQSDSILQDNRVSIGISHTFGRLGYGINTRINDLYFAYDKGTYKLSKESVRIHKFSAYINIYEYRHMYMSIGAGYSYFYDLQGPGIKITKERLIPYSYEIGFNYQPNVFGFALFYNITYYEATFTILYKL